MLLAPYSSAGHHCFALVSAAAATTAEALHDDVDVAVKMDVEMQVDVAEDVPCPCSTQLGSPAPPLSLVLPLLDHLSELQLFSCKSQFLKCSNGNRKRQRRNAENAVDLISTLWPRQCSISPHSPLSPCWCSTATGGGCWKWTMLSSN